LTREKPRQKDLVCFMNGASTPYKNDCINICISDEACAVNLQKLRK
jgi:hypothetical protein